MDLQRKSWFESVVKTRIRVSDGPESKTFHGERSDLGNGDVEEMEVVLDVFWNVFEGVSKYSMRLGSPICRSSSLDVVLQDECSYASSRMRVAIVAGVLQSGGRGHPSCHSSRGAGRYLVPCSFVSLI